VAAGAAGIVFSMLVMLFEVAQLLIHFLRAPQAGVPVIQTTGAGTATWVSAADMMSLMALILSMFGELAFLILSLWLLFRTTVAFVDSGDKQLGHHAASEQVRCHEVDRVLQSAPHGEHPPRCRSRCAATDTRPTSREGCMGY
jgi:hypothetical protein